MIEPEDHNPGTLPAPSPEPCEAKPAAVEVPEPEYGGPSGLEPTRYGDWERRGRCIDF
jgi:hypothetical protein